MRLSGVYEVLYETWGLKPLRYLRGRLMSEDIVTLGVTLSRCVCVHRINLGGEGNAL